MVANIFQLLSSKKTAFVTDKGKWIFHSLPFGINIGPSTFSYVLGKVTMQCSEHALNYCDDIMVFSEMQESDLRHLEEVFEWLQGVDLKKNAANVNFSRVKSTILGYLVGTDGIQPLPEKVAAIQAFEPPWNIGELWNLLGLVTLPM